MEEKEVEFKVNDLVEDSRGREGIITRIGRGGAVYIRLTTGQQVMVDGNNLTKKGGDA